MWAQQASGYNVGGRNFHIKREPMCRIAILEPAKLARPVLPCSLADEPTRPVPETGQAGLPAIFFPRIGLKYSMLMLKPIQVIEGLQLLHIFMIQTSKSINIQ